MRQLLHPRPILVVLSGPSGVGKDAVLRTMKHKGYPLHYTVTLTTRPKRPNEQAGVDYYFTSVDEFRHMIHAGELLEWAQVYGNYYGVPKAPIREALQQGRDVLIKMDVQGASTVRMLAPEAVLVFLLPPSVEELNKRLEERHTECAQDLERRLAAVGEEMKSLSLFDYVLINHDGKLQETADKIQSIITAEKCRTRPRVVELQ